jgi:hypothetical protein
MINAKCYKIFVVHTWEYNESYYRISRYLSEISDFKHEDTGSMALWSSVGEKPPREALLKQMIPAEIVIVNSDVYKSDSERLVAYVMEEAESMGKPIIGIDSWSPHKISPRIVEKAKEIVPWDPLKMVEAIRRYVV